MRTLNVFVEIYGEQRYVGDIIGEDYSDATFGYSDEYLRSGYDAPISISLPLSEDRFSPEKTRCFFEGLLPEGFSRKAVSQWIKTDENDYISILASLGRECLGAIRIVEEGTSEEPFGYKKVTPGQVKKLAEEGATKSTEILMKTHLSLAGATGKVGLYYEADKDKWYLPQGLAPSTYIVKQSHVRLDHIVLNEELCLLTARASGIDVVDSFIINTGDGKDSEILLALKRYDRKMSDDAYVDGHPIPYRLHQEDFAQAMGIPANEKYEREPKHYLQRMFETVRSYCTDPISEQMKLWKMICFNYLIGNTDCHIKNYALLYGENLKSISIAPAYDIVSTRVYNLTNEMSYYIGNEIDIEKITRKSFAEAAVECGLTEKIALKIFDEVANSFEASLKESADYLYELGYTEAKKMKNKIMKNARWR